ncbi:MAG TPA: YeeE/YedE family protein [Deltaproteobacteria bacterium]|nr:YeeE/YedE family protein [Deltaproteobacteria bacterium]
MNILLYGLVTGILFGFLMQKAHVIRYDKQLGALMLKDFTIVKFMISSVIVSMIGIYLLSDLGYIKLDIKSASLGANLIGGLIFGVGWGFVGYCPATAVAAVGEGRWDATFGLAGMLVGAAVYAEAFPLLKESVLAWGNMGKITLHGILGINHWIVIAVLTALFTGMFAWFEKRNL